MSHIDIKALYAALDVHRATHGLSWRTVGEDTGLSASTFTRLRHGHKIDVDGYVVCCRWLGVSTEVFTTGQLTAKPESLAGELVTLLRRYGVPVVYWSPLGELINAARESSGAEVEADRAGTEENS